MSDPKSLPGRSRAQQATELRWEAYGFHKRPLGCNWVLPGVSMLRKVKRPNTIIVAVPNHPCECPFVIACRASYAGIANLPDKPSTEGMKVHV